MINNFNIFLYFQHFVCAKCSVPFKGAKFHEHKGLAYCDQHYNDLIGTVCFKCAEPVAGKIVKIRNKIWCDKHFTCSTCNAPLNLERGKCAEWDEKPMCVECYDELPKSVRKKLINYQKINAKAMAQSPPQADPFQR